jgi:hypothetical protein
MMTTKRAISANPLEISPQQFRQLSERITALASEYLEELTARPIAPQTSGAETLRLFQTPMPEEGI